MVRVLASTEQTHDDDVSTDKSRAAGFTQKMQDSCVCVISVWTCLVPSDDAGSDLFDQGRHG